MADLEGGILGDALDAVEGFGALFTGQLEEEDFEGIDQVGVVPSFKDGAFPAVREIPS